MTSTALIERAREACAKQKEASLAMYHFMQAMVAELIAIGLSAGAPIDQHPFLQADMAEIFGELDAHHRRVGTALVTQTKVIAMGVVSLGPERGLKLLERLQEAQKAGEISARLECKCAACEKGRADVATMLMRIIAGGGIDSLRNT